MFVSLSLLSICISLGAMIDSKVVSESSAQEKKKKEVEKGLEEYKAQILKAMEEQKLELENSKVGLVKAAASCLAEKNVDRAKSVLLGVGFTSDEAVRLVEKLSGLKIDTAPKAEKIRKFKLECEAKLAAQAKKIEELKEKNKKIDEENALLDEQNKLSPEERQRIVEENKRVTEENRRIAEENKILAEEIRSAAEEIQRVDSLAERVDLDLDRSKRVNFSQTFFEEGFMREGQNGQIPEGVTSSFLEAERGVNDLDKLLTENNSQEEHGEPRSSSDVKPKGINISGLFLGAVFLIGVPLAVVCVKRLLRKRMKPKKKTMILKEIRKQ